MIPTLAHTYTGQIDPTGWLMSEKLDGVRALWDGSRLVSRNGNPFPAPAEWLAMLPPIALDGELWLGRVRDAFRACGHHAVSCDLLPTEAPGPHHTGSVLDILGDGWDLMVAHPPCTRLANSGVCWLTDPPNGKTVADMERELSEAVAFYCYYSNRSWW